MTNPIKSDLYRHCLEYVKNHIEINSTAVSKAQEAANSEDKNSAGDKYETGRAMMEREAESIGRRLNEAVAQHKLLLSIDISGDFNTVKPGALVYTSMGNFFIAISADEIEIQGEEYCLISPESPLCLAMANCVAGSSFSFRGKPVKILDIK